MAWVTEDLIEVWKSGLFVGENTPHAVVQVQLGRWIRGWYRQDEVPFPPVRARIWGEGGYGQHAEPGHWGAQWVPDTPVYDLPNLSSIKRTKDFAQNGVTVLEVVLDAQDFVPAVGALGDAYHAIAPGWLAPTRGYVPPGRPDPGWEANEWEGRITDGVMIRVWQGYGAPEADPDTGAVPPISGGNNGAWTFRGMIDDVDLDGDPNQITITARNGKLLTDQRVFRASKSVQLKDPITFWDRVDATIETMRGSGARASSEAAGHPAADVLDPPPADCFNVHAPAYKTSWQASAGGDLQWVEIRLPQGRYRTLWMASPPGQIAYVGIHAKALRGFAPNYANDGHGLVAWEEPAKIDGHPIDEGWIDLGFGNAPDANGGWPFVLKFLTGGTLDQVASSGVYLSHTGRITSASVGLDKPNLGHTFELGRHSILRIGLKGGGVPQVMDLHGLRRQIEREVHQQQFILVDDASEVVKVVLRWAGYQQWDVEEAGVRLSDGTNYGPGVTTVKGGLLAFNRKQALVEIIQTIAKQLGFVFYIADPTDGNSEGVPTFRRDCSLMRGSQYVAAHLSERSMLTGLKVKHTDEDRPSIIRVRGKTAGARDGGLPLGGDAITRIMAVYFPPWAGHRTGGVLRHIVYHDDQLITYAQCLYGCFLIAMQAALQMHTAVAEIPAHPIIELNDQVTILDEPTGTNSRLWIVKAQDTMTLGQNATWKQTLEGSLLDSDDLVAVIQEVLGHAPFTIGSRGPDGITVEHINWRHVIDPSSGRASGYRSPVKDVATVGQGTYTPRTR